MSGGLLTYRKSSSTWGLAAAYEHQTLIFSDALIVAKKSIKNQPINLYNLFSPSSKKAWNNGRLMAKKRKAPMGVEDLFLSLLKGSSVNNLLRRLKVSTSAAEVLLKNYVKLNPNSQSSGIQQIPFEGFLQAIKLHNHKIGTLMLLGALLKSVPQENILQAIFSNIDLSLEKLELFAVWILNLDYEFPRHSKNAKLLYCSRQAQALEEHFGYFFEYPAIEAAVLLSSKQTLPDLEHKKALQYLVKAGLLATVRGTKIISEKLVQKAAGKTV